MRDKGGLIWVCLMFIPGFSLAQNCKCKKIDDAFIRLSYNLNVNNQRIYAPVVETVVVSKDGLSTVRYILNADFVLLENCTKHSFRMENDSLTFMFDEQRERVVLKWLVDNCH